MTSSPRELADRLHQELFATYPFGASMLGVPGYDDRMPDASEAGDAAWRQTVETILRDAAAVDRSALSRADEITLDCVVETAEREIVELDSAEVEHTATAMPFSGPPLFLAVAARIMLNDARAAQDYVTRLRRSGAWVDQVGERLRAGAAKGRVPVAPLVEQAIAWCDRVLAEPVPAALATPTPPDGWAGAEAWQQQRDAAVADVVKPALARWRDTLAELLPVSRSADRPGLTYIADGDADYARAIRLHTTLPLTAEQLHRTGLDEVEALESRAVELGKEIGLADLEAVCDALRASAAELTPAEAMDAALDAIRRAEARAAEVFPQPLPPPCAVTPMPSVVGESGMAPHYSPPRLDGARPGTYWFNTDRPTAGAGWDLEGVAFHEAVPGHHLQLSRIQMLTQLPDLQRLRSLTVFSEGWGLYAEQLAEEIGLYSDTRAVLGSITTALMRAARLVVDTGLHAFGWSRERALEFFVTHVPMPAGFLAAEIDRYIAVPGQALAYLTGKLEILRLRDDARRRLGSTFALPEFHAAVLDSGSLAMPVLRRSIDGWVASRI